MRIGFIAPYLYRFHRGIERSCIHLANELARLDQDVSVLVWNEPKGTTASPLDPRIRIVKVPYMRFYQEKWAVPFYAYELITRPYDAINIFFAGHGEAEAIWLARKFRPLKVNFIVGYPIDLVPHRFEEFKRCGLKDYLNHIVVKSPPMAPEIARFFGKEVDFIPNGVDAAIFDPVRVDAGPLRKRLGIKEDDIVLITVAALDERKGIQHVIRVLPALLQAGFSVYYLVVGEGPYRETLESLVTDCNVSERVHFTGVQSDVLPYYKLADIFLLLSYGEGFPNVLLEAWAMSLPVVVAKHPPYPSIINEGTGLMVDEKDLKEVSDVLLALLDSPQKRREIGVNGRCMVKERYTWSAVASRYREIFAN